MTQTAKDERRVHDRCGLTQAKAADRADRRVASERVTDQRITVADETEDEPDGIEQHRPGDKPSPSSRSVRADCRVWTGTARSCDIVLSLRCVGRAEPARERRGYRVPIATSWPGLFRGFDSSSSP